MLRAFGRMTMRCTSSGLRTIHGPLREIIGYVDVELAPGVDVQHEKLECGHVFPIRTDMIGKTNAYRRRCWRCRDEASNPNTEQPKA
jgi:hypothetical protein